MHHGCRPVKLMVVMILLVRLMATSAPCATVATPPSHESLRLVHSMLVHKRNGPFVLLLFVGAELDILLAGSAVVELLSVVIAAVMVTSRFSARGSVRVTATVIYIDIGCNIATTD